MKIKFLNFQCFNFFFLLFLVILAPNMNLIGGGKEHEEYEIYIEKISGDNCVARFIFKVTKNINF